MVTTPREAFLRSPSHFMFQPRLAALGQQSPSQPILTAGSGLAVWINIENSVNLGNPTFEGPSHYHRLLLVSLRV